MHFKTVPHFYVLHAWRFRSFGRYPVQTWVKQCLGFALCSPLTRCQCGVAVVFPLKCQCFSLSVNASSSSASASASPSSASGLRSPSYPTSKSQAMSRPRKNKIRLRELARRNLKRCRYHFPSHLGLLPLLASINTTILQKAGHLSLLLVVIVAQR